MKVDPLVRRLRYGLAAAIALVAIGCIVLMRTATGSYYDTAQMTVLMVARIAFVVVLGFVLIDFVFHVVRTVFKGRAGTFRAAARSIMWTVAADAGLLAFALGCALAVAELAT